MAQFRENLVYLRDIHSMTQEQLAMLVGVSRQSVQKWEAGKSTPDIEKLQKLCSIFDTTMDELIQGDVHNHEASKFAKLDSEHAQDVFGYAEHMYAHARNVALAISILSASMGVAFFVCGSSNTIENEPLLFLLPLFTGSLFGLFVLLNAYNTHDYFKKSHPFIQNFYTPEAIHRMTSHMMKYQFAGICACVLGVLVLIAIQTAPNVPIFAFHPLIDVSNTPDNDSLLGISLFMIIEALGVGAIVFAANVKSSLNIDAYNQRIAIKEERFESLEVMEGLGEKTLTRKKVGYICSVTMAVATIVGLGVLFIVQTFAPELMGRVPFWLAWVIGGIVCWTVGVVYGTKKK